MLLPKKHISFAESLLGLGIFILEELKSPQSIDSLWRKFEKIRVENFPAYHSFDNLVLTVDALFAVSMIEVNESGELKRRTPELKTCA